MLNKGGRVRSQEEGGGEGGLGRGGAGWEWGVANKTWPIQDMEKDGGLRDITLAGYFTSFSLCLTVARVDTPPLQPAAFAFVSYGFVLVRVRVLFGFTNKQHRQYRNILMVIDNSRRYLLSEALTDKT